MKNNKFKSEVDLAKPVIEYLQNLKWEVYQEVQLYYGSPIADIVAVQHKIIWVVECKKTLSLNLLDQANVWRHYAHYVSVAVPYTRRRRPQIVEEVLKWKGIGLLEVGPEWGNHEVNENIGPRLNRKGLFNYIFNALDEGHKTFAEAGNPDGKRWSPFQQTVMNLKRVVAKHPGITMKELMDNNDMKHHYSSSATARSSILKWIQSGIIKGIKLEREGKAYKLYMEENGDD